jgi:predicted nicotinamide N-methyase
VPPNAATIGRMDFRTQIELFQLPIPGGWKWESVSLQKHSWRLLLPADPDAFILQTEGEDWPDPYWAQVWPAAKAMAELVLTPHWPVGKRVLELGCGNGFVGLAALARGCHVTFSDYVPFAVELAVANALCNGLEKVSGIVLDWRNPARDLRFDTLVAADVFYDPELHLPLLSSIDQLLQPEGTVWLGDPGRSTLATSFVRQARAEGWQVALFDRTHQACAEFVNGEFRLLEMTRE